LSYNTRLYTFLFLMLLVGFRTDLWIWFWNRKKKLMKLWFSLRSITDNELIFLWVYEYCWCVVLAFMINWKIRVLVGLCGGHWICQCWNLCLNDWGAIYSVFFGLSAGALYWRKRGAHNGNGSYKCKRKGQKCPCLLDNNEDRNWSMDLKKGLKE